MKERRSVYSFSFVQEKKTTCRQCVLFYYCMTMVIKCDTHTHVEHIITCAKVTNDNYHVLIRQSSPLSSSSLTVYNTI